MGSRHVLGKELFKRASARIILRVAEEVVIEVPEQALPNFLSPTWTSAFPMRTCGYFLLMDTVSDTFRNFSLNSGL